MQGSDGSLEVTGDLIITQIERPVLVNSSEAYAGAEYGDPVVRTSSQEVTFHMVPAIGTGAEQNNISISAIARIRGETFPELLPAISRANWPLIVQDKKFEVPFTVGEGYYGSLCTGTAIMIENGPAPVTCGEDYPGFGAFTSEWSDVKITLDLKLTQNI